MRPSDDVLRDIWTTEEPRLRRYLQKALNGDRTTAEDLTAESITQLAAAMERGTVDDPRALFRHIAQRRLIDEIRRRRDGDIPSGDLYGLDSQESEESPVEKTRGYSLTLDASLFGVEFDRAVRALPSPERDAFILTELRGLSAHEAAPYLGVSQPTVSTRQRAALHSLRDALS